MCFARQKFRLGRQAGKESTENSKDGIYSVDLLLLLLLSISLFVKPFGSALYSYGYLESYLLDTSTLYHVRGTRVPVVLLTDVVRIYISKLLMV